MSPLQQVSIDSVAERERGYTIQELSLPGGRERRLLFFLKSGINFQEVKLTALAAAMVLPTRMIPKRTTKSKTSSLHCRRCSRWMIGMVGFHLTRCIHTHSQKVLTFYSFEWT